MIKKIIWYSVACLAMAGFVLLSSGFYRAMSLTAGTNEQTGTESGKTPKAGSNTKSVKPNTIRITVIGDSIAKGTGDETGNGFTIDLPEIMRTKTSKEVSVENAGIDGLKSDGLLELLKSGKLDTVLKVSDFILISIGGNDLRTLQQRDETSRQEDFKILESQYSDNLKKTMERIRKNNINAYMVFIGLYNPFVTTGSFADSGLVRTWNYNTQQLAETDDRTVFVSTYDLFKFNTERYIAPDELHPNSAGYKSISERIVDSIESIIVNK